MDNDPGVDEILDVPRSRGQVRRFFAKASGFWTMEGCGRAWFLTILVFTSAFAQIGVNVLYTMWNKWFFDALSERDAALVWHYVLFLIPLVLTSATIGTTVVVSRLMLQMRWRQWLTRRMMGWWISDQRYYRLNFSDAHFAAPEYRIAEDTRLAVEPLADFAIGLTSAVVTACTFATILWKVGGALDVTFAGHAIHIPAFLAIAAVAYAGLVSIASYFCGRPLADVVGAKNEFEAAFRGEMTRLRENAESIALVRGDEDERRSLGIRFDSVINAWRAVIRRQGILGIVQNSNSAIYTILPLLLVAPKYLSAELTLGDVMQVSAAFAAVQGALIWFVDNFVRLSEWYASLRRVNELVDTLDRLDITSTLSGDSRIEMTESDDGALHLEHLSIGHRGGKIVISETSTKIERGERVLIVGESGTGKSTLIRAIAGLWPWGSGSISLPAGARIAFLPQKPYIPIGTLKDALSYPTASTEIPEAVLTEAMREVGLGYLASQLNVEKEWDQTLSGGERQRVAFARLILHKPDLIIMDEATSALDDDSQTKVLDLLRLKLDGATIVSVGHRPGLEEYHTRKITLERNDLGAKLSSREVDGKLFKLLRLLKLEVFSGKATGRNG